MCANEQKVQIWEGGTRVAGFVSGGSPLLPAAVRGTISHKLMHMTDWLPTLTGLITPLTAASGAATTREVATATRVSDASMAAARPIDGHNMWSALTEASTPSPRTEMLYNINPLCHGGQASAPKAAIRIGKYKLLAWCFDVRGIDGASHTGPRAAPANTTRIDPAFKENSGLVMYDLEADEAETTNLVASPDLAPTRAHLLARLTELADESVEPQQWAKPYQGKDYACADCPLHPGGEGVGKPWMPWVDCSKDEDCNRNGVCEAGSCSCADGWSGVTCGQRREVS